ncbi:MAG: cell division topological specificity factor MinE [Anaerolineae bacterium]|nr:cell division topological specificity factor MinE [Anaerolineae bacterium]
MKLLDLFRRKKKSGQYIAAQRLRLVLTHDRANISPGMLEVLKDEIIAVISKHLDIDTENVVVNLTEDNRRTRLVADIPILTNRARKAEVRSKKGAPGKT